MLAPIALFAYARPHLIQKTLDSLKENEDITHSELFIFCDGAKADATHEQIAKINEVRAIAKKIDWCKKLTVIESEKNCGLANSIINGVTKLVNEYGSIIVIEDDVLLSRHFLSFMNDAIQTYQNNGKVISIGSWNYYYNPENSSDNYFLRYPDTIAWATFKRAWDLFIHDPSIALHKLKETKKLNYFNVNGASHFFENTLQAQIEKKVDSWAIRWTATAVLNDALCLYPRYSLAKHIGFGEGATHETGGDNFDTGIELSEKKVDVEEMPVKENTAALNDWKQFLTGLENKNTIHTIKSAVKRIIPHFIKKIIRNAITPKPNSGWFGNFHSWKDAEKSCVGYQSHIILEKVKTAILKVKNGEAAYERDSMLFDEIQHSQDLINAFECSIEKNALHVVDFGGSLGSTYFQYKTIFNKLSDFKWAVVEQKHFVECGKSQIADDHLHFYYTIDDALQKQSGQVLLLSSVLQYFPEPYSLIEKLISYNFKYIIIDRTAFIEGNKERITIQKVPELIYKASYPSWFFNEQKFVDTFTKRYNLMNGFDCKIDPREKLEDGILSYRKGFFFKLINDF